jgi:glycerol-3-phosphate dehydrogenase
VGPFLFGESEMAENGNLVRGAAIRSLDQIYERPVDVLVVGGGIVGAGVSRDAALRGFHTVLVDRSDFASGTSSRSSRLLHGGMRYLAQGRIGLVHEASREKRVLGRIAPHLAEPLAFIFPGRKETSWPRWKLAIGAKLYDLLCGMRNFGGSKVLSRRATLDLLPGLSERNLTGSVRYFDALTNDARLVIDTLRSAARHGAAAFNYVQLIEARREGNEWHCELADSWSGKTYTVRARTVVNASGPWSDKLPNSKTSLRLTKGVHLVVDRDRLPVPDAVVMAEGERILFAIPWGERVILGTTDTDYDGPLECPTCDEVDIKYVLEVVNDAFPRAGLSAADIVSTWAGLRPLVADPHGKPSDISRRHEITMTHPGWWDVTGGKLTTYRLMAQETVDAIATYSDRTRSRCNTAKLPLIEAGENVVNSGILPPPVSRGAVEYFCRVEWARHLDDVMIRRTSWRHYHHDHLEIAARSARWMATFLNWDESATQSELVRYQQLTGANGLASPRTTLPLASVNVS